jgi:hypothetical protein
MINKNEQLIENTKKACDIVLDAFLDGVITKELRDAKLKKLSDNWNRYEKNENT